MRWILTVWYHYCLIKVLFRCETLRSRTFERTDFPVGITMKVQTWMKLTTWTKTSGLITGGAHWDLLTPLWIIHLASIDWIPYWRGTLWDKKTNKTWFISLKESYLWFDLSFQRGKFPNFFFLFHGENCSYFSSSVWCICSAAYSSPVICFFFPVPLQRSHSNHFWLCS